MRLIGIDEAGRGPVLGPMVMAAVVLLPEREQEFKDMGVRDSKLFGSSPKSRRDRSRLRPLIEERCVAFSVIEFEPSQIDEYCRRHGLDDLEREGALQLLKNVGATTEDRIVCDGESIFSPLKAHWPNLVAEPRADARHVSVGAASILAKVTRDDRMELAFQRYEPEFGKINGGGYVNEPTRRFMEAYEAKYGQLPPETRTSWTWRRVQGVEDPTDLLAFLAGG